MNDTNNIILSLDHFSLVIPAKNEAASLNSLLPALRDRYGDIEIIVVDDGSTDNTEQICIENRVVLLKHPYSKGNGAAVKNGALKATREYLIMLDADGQHRPEDIQPVMDKLGEGYDMVVGCRNFSSQASLARGVANSIYNWFASKVTGHTIKDLTSGLRGVKKSEFLRFLPLLPNGFSYPSTITMAFFRSSLNVCYVPITAERRIGQSHIQPIRDGVRFLLIIFKLTTLYSPLKIFFPIATVHLLLGLFYYSYTYITAGRFTNMGVTLLISSIIIFLIGLISEQITTLTYTSLEAETESEQP